MLLPEMITYVFIGLHLYHDLLVIRAIVPLRSSVHAAYLFMIYLTLICNISQFSIILFNFQKF